MRTSFSIPVMGAMDPYPEYWHVYLNHRTYIGLAVSIETNGYLVTYQESGGNFDPDHATYNGLDPLNVAFADGSPISAFNLAVPYP